MNMPPIVIGGTGGSGTRVIVSLMHEMGGFAGAAADLNKAGDNMLFAAFLDQWLDGWLMNPNGDWVRMKADFERIVKHVEAGGKDIELNFWGWKNPRMMLLLPFLHRMVPELKFIHLVRDGRDMAFSSNQNQVVKHARALGVSGDELPLRSIRFWARANAAAADFGETYMAERYLRIRFEDVCNHASSVVADLAAFWNEPDVAGLQHAVEQIVRMPASLGRGKSFGMVGRLKIDAEVQQSLERFGYT